MGSIDVIRNRVDQVLRNVLLIIQWKSLILIAEQKHGWHLVPGLVYSKLNEGLLWLRLQFGDCLLLRLW